MLSVGGWRRPTPVSLRCPLAMFGRAEWCDAVAALRRAGRIIFREEDILLISLTDITGILAAISNYTVSQKSEPP